MNPAPELRAGRLRDLVCAVAAQALLDRAATHLALLDDASPEAGLAAGWLEAGLGAERVVRVGAATSAVESLLLTLPAARPVPHGSADRSAASDQAGEVRRCCARLRPGSLLANPANKTALLLGGPPPPDPFFPLGDLYASEVEELAGGWSGPAGVQELAEHCGGIRPLDQALRMRIDRRDPRGLDRLPAAARVAVEAALAAGRAARVFGTVVPKIGARTMGVDLFE